MKFKDYLKEEQKTWTFKDWFWWYWYGFTTEMSIRFYWFTKLQCRIFGHSQRFKDECGRCGIDLI